MVDVTRELLSSSQRWLALVEDEDLSESELENFFIYQDSSGAKMQKRLGPVLTHVFNHQTHHRGQATAALTRLLGKDHCPSLDLLYYLAEQPEEQR
mmetsp:Transcript_58307/g.137430  ORF Transcript_58307/g.137430 Transcript_58307/m.137430 type:complete len:96 (+) Transcript_58307:155-442(+)